MAASITVGLSLRILAEKIKEAKEQSGKARTILENLAATIRSVSPMINQLEKLSKTLDTLPEDVMLRLDQQLKKAAELVKSYHDLGRRHIIKKHRYQKRLVEMDASLRQLVTIDIQVAQLVNLKNLLVKMTEMNKKLETMSLDVNSAAASSGAVEAPSSSHCHCETCSCHQRSSSPKHTFEITFKFCT